MVAGYSGTPLVKKLGIKPGDAIAIIDAPENYWDLLGELPKGVTVENGGTGLNFIHVFVTEAAALAARIDSLRQRIKPNGMIWVSWPKKAAKVPIDLNENVVREIALAQGLVDVKVAAIDEKWSGLKLVIRVKDREI
jgi:hypothetical protein